jgi:ACS family tartrate transporter-like MFS transporter
MQSERSKSELELFAKCARRIIPWMILLYLVNVLDRVNVSFAALTMNKDVGFSPIVYSLGAGILFIGYTIFQIPSNLILERIGARRWISLILVVWGVLSSANAFISDAYSFYVLRFLLGIAESGFYPAMLLYLTYWFPQAYRGRFTAQFMVSVPLSFIIGGPISGFILKMDGIGGLHGWQWLFLLEGLPAALLAFAVIRILPDGPRDAPWLTKDEQDTIVFQLAAGDSTARYQNLWPALLDPRVPLLGLVTFGIIMGYYGIGLWLPQIVQAMGFSNFATGFVVGSLFVVSMAVMIAWARSSDIKGERIWHIALPAIFAAGAFIVASIATIANNNLLTLTALSLAAAGLFCMPGPFWSLASSFLRGTASAGGLAFINLVGGLGGFVGPNLIGFLKESTGGYAAGMAALAVGPLVGAFIVLTLGRALTLKQALPR